ncbi:MULTISPECIES: twin-arginine translocation signal domain-containing protein [Halorubrum]|uniref:Uncharacterized protein n=2 Tax=Halorubrum TaxID=56688 RepID=M0F7I4_9EURY|nr:MULTISPECIES: twin-arginine translocation signal domain-containing protein [Halorubrum]ELZ38597.1 hypothetical protein C472_06984 [Halorubrum tebenquichense DSM 14210]ELZ54564.1 hypothetical protein C467_11445 [Halorubrum hochstenium ATCC 700873]
MERRSFLSAGGAAALALAVGSPSIARIESDGPVAVVEAYYRRASDAEDAEAFADDVRDLAHSASPLSELAGDAPMAFDGTVRQRFVESVVIAEDLSPDRIRSVSGFLAASLTADGTESIAAENALVSVTVEADDGELELRWLVATDGGEWRLVWPGEPDET